MEDEFQIAFNIILVFIILSVMLIISFRSKLAKAVGINPVKEQAVLVGETIGASILIAFLIFTVFAVGYWGS